jgi:hypothetical protein
VLTPETPRRDSTPERSRQGDAAASPAGPARVGGAHASMQVALQDPRDRGDGLAAVLRRAVAQRNAPAAGSRLLQRGYDPQFTYGGGSIEKTKLTSQKEVNDAVDFVMDEHFGGYRNLFTQGEVASSPAAWAKLVYSYLEDAYELRGVGRPEVLTAVRAMKDKYREETLLHMATVNVYWSGEEPPYTVADLKGRLETAGSYLEDEDEDVLTAIVATEGKFARTKIQMAPLHIELSDEDEIVVIMDHHQQKHQFDKIPEFPAYTGDPGTKFRAGKGLEWHRDNTVPVVRDTIAEAVSSGKVTPEKEYLPRKKPKDGIVYDLNISYDASTGKYVGSYHCNPLVEEN